MKEDNDIFKKFRDSFSKIDGHFHILEQRVPVERQMEYFKYSEKIRKDQDKPDISKMDFSVFEDSLDDPESTTSCRTRSRFTSLPAWEEEGKSCAFMC